MDKLIFKKLLLVIIITAVAVILFMPSFYAKAEETNQTYYVIHKAQIYADKDTESPVLDTLNRNSAVFIVNLDEAWATVEYDGNTGFIKTDLLYKRLNENVTTTIQMGYATATQNERIKLFTSPDDSNEPALTITDGTQVEIIFKDEKYTKILYNDMVYYAKNQNITTGITRYQKLAIYIGAISVGSIIIVFLLAYINNNSKREKK